jgi:N-methylhydantoinase A
VISVRRGHDPREFILVVFGGAGAVHAGALASDLGIQKVLIPKSASTFSAIGCLLSDLKIAKSRTFLASSERIDLNTLNTLIQKMTDEVRQEFEAQHEQGREVAVSSALDLHYPNETADLTVPLNGSSGQVVAQDVTKAMDAFHDLHKRIYEVNEPESPVEVRNVRVEGMIRSETVPQPEHPALDGSVQRACEGKRLAFFEPPGEYADTPVYRGEHLGEGDHLRGPVIIEEPGTTVVVYPGQEVSVDKFGNYRLNIPEPVR